MGNIRVDKALLEKTIQEVSDCVRVLTECSADLEHVPGHSVTLRKVTSVSDGIRALIEFSSRVGSEIKASKMDSILGSSSKAKRKARTAKADK
jgi:hypothetical protein